MRTPYHTASLAQGDMRPVHARMRAAAGDRNVWIVKLTGVQQFGHGFAELAPKGQRA